MRLQRFVSRRHKGRTYYKWVMNPPTKLIERLGWEPGDDIAVAVRDDRLILKRRDPGEKRKASAKVTKASVKADTPAGKASAKKSIRDLW